jgi:hypothetical protein
MDAMELKMLCDYYSALASALTQANMAASILLGQEPQALRPSPTRAYDATGRNLLTQNVTAGHTGRIMLPGVLAE